MLTAISLRNFRSIHKAELTLQPLTVLVGANGSGKSNLVRAIDFIHRLATDGLGTAVYEHGAKRGILPKAIAEKDLSRSLTEISYTAFIGSPEGYADGFPQPFVEHLLQLQWSEGSKYKVSREVLSFDQPLATSAARAARDAGMRAIASAMQPSRMAFVRNEVDFDIETTPELTNANTQAFGGWFGLEYFRHLGITTSTPSEFRAALKHLAAGEQPPMGSFAGSLLEVRQPSALVLSAHYQRFLDIMRRVSQFDFDLDVLREEQDAVYDHIPLPDGSFTPAALRWLTEESPPDWARITDTLRDLAPHVIETSIADLATGREYIQFLETVTGRPVESWNASDGTLRALAMLIALETSPDSGVVVIEEPELRLHPWAVQALMRHIRDVVSRRKLQVILTTHSQQVIDQATPKELLIASRSPETGTVFESAQQIAPGLADTPGELGRMWVKGVLGGVPVSGGQR